jgi:hypothetical protein
LAFVDSVDASQFEGKETSEIVLRPGTPKEKTLSGQAYLANYGLPQFFFHVTTAYNILRHNGLPIGKRDFMTASMGTVAGCIHGFQARCPGAQASTTNGVQANNSDTGTPSGARQADRALPVINTRTGC